MNAKDLRDEGVVRRGRAIGRPKWAQTPTERAKRKRAKKATAKTIKKLFAAADGAPWFNDDVKGELARQKAILKAAGYRWPFPCLYDRKTNTRVNARLFKSRYGPCWMLLDADDVATGKFIPHPGGREKPDPHPVQVQINGGYPIDEANLSPQLQLEVEMWQRREAARQTRRKRWEAKYGVLLGSEELPARVKVQQGRTPAASRVVVVRK